MTFDLEYNSERDKLMIPEYGRHLQKLVDYCVAIEDRDERNKMAKAIIGVMGNLQPHLRDVPDFKHKLWDQLFIIADYKLDVDSPYPITSQEELEQKPERLPYPKVSSKYRYYGHNMQTMIDVAISWKDDALKEKLIYSIANHMKKCYLLWNKDTVSDHIIKEHLLDLSNGQLDIDLDKEALIASAVLMKGNKRNQNNQNSKNGKNNKNKKKRYKRN